MAQIAFALAYKAYPFSLTVWRSVLLAVDLVTFGLILLLLRTICLPALWSVLYWWNPLFVKEVFNLAHMEPIVVVFVLGALALLVSRKPFASVVTLAFAAAAKLWPVLLLPLLLRSQDWNWPRMALLVLVFTGISALLFAPVVLSSLDFSSGFVAYVEKWQTNSAVFLIFSSIVKA